MKRLVILSVFIVIFCLYRPLSASAEGAAGYTYTVIGQEVTVTGFTGEPEIIDIPPYIDGLPVTEVRDNAFFRCEKLRRISLPATVKRMGHHCLYGCRSLEEVILPKRLETMGMGCFDSCTSLKSVILPDTLEVLPDSCFRRCTSLTEMIAPQSIKAIEKFCFCGCTSLSYVSLSGKLESIGIGALYQCSSLDTIYVPPSVTDIGTEALGYITDTQKTSLTIIGCTDSAAEEYAESNGIDFSPSPETVQAFDPATSENSPVKLPPALAASGGLLFLLAALIALKQYITDKKDCRSIDGDLKSKKR